MGRMSYVTIKGSKLSFGYPQNELCQNLNADMVDNYHASSIPAPNVIPVTNDEGKIPSEFLPSTGGAFERIDLTNATEDYELQRGQEAYYSFSDITELLLHIATFDGTYYEMDLLPSNPGSASGAVDNRILLYPNNTAYNNKFVGAEFNRDSNGFFHAFGKYSGFILGSCYASIKIFIVNQIIYKDTRSFANRYGCGSTYPSAWIGSCSWRDTTTPWTSLGTVIFPQQSSGEILIRRLK